MTVSMMVGLGWLVDSSRTIWGLIFSAIVFNIKKLLIERLKCTQKHQ